MSVAPSEVSTPESANGPPLRARKKVRLASDVIGQLEDKLEEDDCDLRVWLELIQRTVHKDKIENVREVYERFLKKFPFLSAQWISYIEYEQSRGEFDKVNDIFKRCLVKVTGVELWKCYVNFVRRKNNLITGGDEARRVIFQAYDLAANKVGMDPESGSLWVEYLNFINDWRPNSTWDEQQKMDLKRKVYRKCLLLPLSNLETLWSEYTAFENDLNATTARKFISEISGNYMNARSLYKEWSNLTHGLDRDFNKIPSPGDYDASQLAKWRSWIKWEHLNKMELSEEALSVRIDYIYNQALQKLLFYPELWFDYVEYGRENDMFFSKTKIQEILTESLLANPTSFALNFKLIEGYELDSNSQQVHKRYDTLIERLTAQHTRLDIELEDLKESIIASETQKRSRDGEEVKEMTEEEKEHLFKKNKRVQHLIAQLQRASKIITLTYCQYMKTMKRMSGLEEGRAVFKKCRKSSKKTLTHHLFVENAFMEYKASDKNGKNIAMKVFELGLRPQFFGNDGEFIYKYLKFLMQINDDVNIRTVFETTISSKKETVDPQWIKKMFKIFMNHEIQNGQLSSVEKLEKKYFEMFPDESKLLLFADRYSFNTDIDDYRLDDDLIRFVDLRNTDLVSRETNKRKHEDGADGVNKRVHFSDLLDGDAPTQSELSEEEPAQEDNSQFVTDEIYNLLRVLPNSSYFDTPLFNNSKLIRLLSEMS